MEIGHVGFTDPVHARTEIHKPNGPCNQRGEKVRGEHVDREHVFQPVGRQDPLGLAIAHTGVMDDGVVVAERVRLLRDSTGLGDAREVTDHHCLCLREGGPGRDHSPSIPGVQRHQMALTGEERRCHQAKPVSGTGDQDT